MRVFVIFGLLLFIFSSIHAQNRICFEDFEGVTPGAIPRYDPTGSGEIDEVTRTLYGTYPPLQYRGAFLPTGGNPGQCARAYVDGSNPGGDSYSEIKWRFDSRFNNSKTVYAKFDFKLDPNLEGEFTDFKIIRITDYQDASAASSNEWHPQLQVPPSSSGYSWYTWSQGSCNHEYYFNRATTKIANHMNDNQWHTYEIFLDIGTVVGNSSSCDGIVRMWEDGILVLEDTHVPYRCSSSEGQGINSMTFIRHCFGLGSNWGNVYFDNLEVWDDMPTEVHKPTGLLVEP